MVKERKKDKQGQPKQISYGGFNFFHGIVHPGKNVGIGLVTVWKRTI
jgi:hypothetical protein